MSLLPVFFLLLLPWFIFFINSGWIYTPKATIDPWLYHGYFLNFQQFVHFFPDTYYGTRLPWILPGFFFYHLFKPIVANYCLHLLYFYLAIFAFYYIVRNHINQRAAFLTTVLFSAHPYFLRSIGWDYVDGACTAYYLLTFSFLTKAISSKRPGFFLVISGAFFSAMGFSYITWFLTFPTFIAYYLIGSSGANTFRRSITALLLFLAGVFLMTCLLGTAQALAGGDFLFYKPTVNFAFSLARSANPWKSPTFDWVLKANWLFLPALAFCSGISYVLMKFLKNAMNTGKSGLFFMLNLAFVFLLQIFWELNGQPVLQYNYFATILIAPSFFVVAFLVGLSETSTASFLAAFILTLIAGWLPLGDSGRTVFEGWSHLRNHAILLVVIAFIVWAVRPWFRDGFVAFVLFIFGFSIANAVIYRPFVGIGEKTSFSLVTSALAEVREVAGVRKPRFWMGSAGTPFSGEYAAVASAYLWSYTLINTEFPSLEHYDKSNAVKNGDLLVLMSTDEKAFEKAEAALKQLRLGLALKEKRTACEEDICIPLIFTEVSDL